MFKPQQLILQDLIFWSERFSASTVAVRAADLQWDRVLAIVVALSFVESRLRSRDSNPLSIYNLCNGQQRLGSSPSEGGGG